MGRPSTGSLVYIEPKSGEALGHYCVRLTLPDGRRPRVHLEPGPKSPKARKRALERAAAALEQLRTPGAHTGPIATSILQDSLKKSEQTARDEGWWERFFLHREAAEMSHSQGRFRKHVLPKLAEIKKTIFTVAVADCEAIRDHLDDIATSGKCSGDTVVHAWHVFTVACKAASGRWRYDKRRTLKVRDDNPCLSVLPPESAKPKELQWLYPNEFEQLVACEKVPREDRELYAVATYMFGRASELIPLDWSMGDFDLEHGTVSIRRAWNTTRRKLKAPKTTSGVRRFNIEPTLLPLLRVMHARSGGVGPVVKVRFRHDWAGRLREHLRLAGITRPELFETDGTRKRIRFHDLRATGLTWLALRRDSTLSIQIRAGHSSFAMTRRYVRVAETVGQDVGIPFPALPQNLLGCASFTPQAEEARPSAEVAKASSPAQKYCPEIRKYLESLAPGGMRQPIPSTGKKPDLLPRPLGTREICCI